ncbi:PLAC8-domain-containing protein [Rhizodiscina lignyota]|uniref:PLAC8-domain-containing protein n=1 Tax=Rhizodiscina lignyota TaxID=1504668 RepID=A0A9P4M8C8_9PEZI|nr:PLAC8-domain-containing protein [Rhizodiscina lignyota]
MAYQAAPEEWRVPATGCCSPVGDCCMGYWLPCVVYGRVHYRLRQDAQLRGYSACNGACWGHFGLMACCGVQWVLQFMQRGELRRRYNIDGNGCTDCLCSTCCGCCDIIQQDKEMKNRETQPILDAEPKRNEGMHYAPQDQPPTYQNGQQNF